MAEHWVGELGAVVPTPSLTPSPTLHIFGHTAAAILGIAVATAAIAAVELV